MNHCLVVMIGDDLGQRELIDERDDGDRFVALISNGNR